MISSFVLVLSPPIYAHAAIISFSGVSLLIVHLGHILSFDNSDNADILFKALDLVRKANLMLHTFSAADPLISFTAYLSMAAPCGIAPITHSALSSFNAFGISHAIAILGFCTSRLYCPAFSMWFHPGLSSFPCIV